MKKMLLRTAGLCGFMLLFCACKPDAINQLEDSGSALKTVFVDEIAKASSANKQIVMITVKATEGANADLSQEIKGALEKKGLSVVETRSVDLGDPMNYNQFGLKAVDFLEVLQKHAGVGAIVSLVGAPILSANDFGKIPPTHPPVLVLATRQIGLAFGVPANPAVIDSMLKSKVIQLAVVDGPGSSGSTDTIHKTFDQHFSILR